MTALDPGLPFPEIKLQDASGNPAAPASGETLYAFFKTTCPTTEMSWPYLERIRRMAEGGALRVVAVSQDSAPETAEFNRRFDVKVETLYDPPPWSASETLGLTNVPAFFMVDGEGTILDNAAGFQKEKMELFAARAAKLAGLPYAGLFRPGENVPPIKPG